MDSIVASAKWQDVKLEHLPIIYTRTVEIRLEGAGLMVNKHARNHPTFEPNFLSILWQFSDTNSLDWTLEGYELSGHVKSKVSGNLLNTKTSIRKGDPTPLPKRVMEIIESTRPGDIPGVS